MRKGLLKTNPFLSATDHCPQQEDVAFYSTVTNLRLFLRVK